MRGIELVELGNGEVIVNVTEYTELAEVTDQLSREWEWDSYAIEWDDEGKTEWLVLENAKRRVTQAAA